MAKKIGVIPFAICSLTDAPAAIAVSINFASIFSSASLSGVAATQVGEIASNAAAKKNGIRIIRVSTSYSAHDKVLVRARVEAQRQKQHTGPVDNTP